MNTFKMTLRFLALSTLLAWGAACTPHFKLPTADDFGVLAESYPYDFRAVTPDGLVMAVREFKYEKKQGELPFWVKAIENEVRSARGYALLEQKSVTTKGGLTGTQLRFGMDRDGEAHEYIVTVFAVDKGKKLRLYVLEAGGREALVRAHRRQIDWSIDEFVGR